MLQEWLRAVVTDPRGAAAAVSGGNGLEQIAAHGRGTRLQRLDVYAEGYLSRIAAALAVDFPLLRRAAGGGLFDRIVAEYLKRHPSRTTNIGEVGRHLAAFLRESDVLNAGPEWADLAMAEWLAIESFYAPSMASLSADRWSAIPADAWPRARFRLDPSLRWLESRVPFERLWPLRREGAAFDLELSPAPRVFLLDRRNGEVRLHTAAKFELILLERLRDGLTLSEATAALPDGVAGDDVSAAFAHWIADGRLTDVMV
jgi:hypothetical protein